MDRWETQDFRSRIETVYHLRCELVHNGDWSRIKRSHLLFTDGLILNLLHNLTALHRLFDCKDAVIDFAERLEMEQRLGIRSRVRPKRLRFSWPIYSERDIAQTDD